MRINEIRCSRPQQPIAPSADAHVPGTLLPLRPDVNTVWNGQPLTWPVKNDATNEQWASIRIDGLTEGEYELHSDASGAGWVDPGDRIPLPPRGTIQFTLKVNCQRNEPHSFHLYGYIHTTEARQDGGEMGLNKEFRWVPHPTPEDVEVQIHPEDVTLRPWHIWGIRRPKIRIVVQNLSYLEMRCKPEIYPCDKFPAVRSVCNLHEQTVPPRIEYSWRLSISPGRQDWKSDTRLCARASVVPPEGVSDCYTIDSAEPATVVYLPIPWSVIAKRSKAMSNYFAKCIFYCIVAVSIVYLVYVLCYVCLHHGQVPPETRTIANWFVDHVQGILNTGLKDGPVQRTGGLINS